VEGVATSAPRRTGRGARELTETEVKRLAGVRSGGRTRLYRWRRRLGAERVGDEGPEFVELRPRGADRVEVVLRSGHVLRVAETIDPKALARIVAALEQSGPC
jgi:hypothetical protein